MKSGWVLVHSCSQQRLLIVHFWGNRRFHRDMRLVITELRFTGGIRQRFHVELHGMILAWSNLASISLATVRHAPNLDFRDTLKFPSQSDIKHNKFNRRVRRILILHVLCQRAYLVWLKARSICLQYINTLEIQCCFADQQYSSKLSTALTR